jgi:hypothetical protein
LKEGSGKLGAIDTRQSGVKEKSEGKGRIEGIKNCGLSQKKKKVGRKCEVAEDLKLRHDLSRGSGTELLLGADSSSTSPLSSLTSVVLHIKAT